MCGEGLALAVCGEGLRLAVCGEGLRLAVCGKCRTVDDKDIGPQLDIDR